MKTNPFDPISDPDRHHIWHRLVQVDCEAFVAADFSLVESDFDPDHFEGIRCSLSANPEDWQLVFPDLASYRENWLKAAREFQNKKLLKHTPLEAILFRTHLDRIDINGNRALAHKQFHGDVPLADGSSLSGSRQTLFRLHKQGGLWKIVGFLGFLPLVPP
jgi:hypothetical protein